MTSILRSLDLTRASNMRTRSRHKTVTPPEKRATHPPRSTDQEHLKKAVDTLNTISERVHNSEVVLSSKIDNIEKTQTDILLKLSDVHDAMYDPDNGLFARVNSNEIKQNNNIKTLEAQHIAACNLCQAQQKETTQQIASEIDKRCDILERDVEIIKIEQRENSAEDETSIVKLVTLTGDLDKRVIDLYKWRSTLVTIVKWIITVSITVGGGIVTKVVADSLSAGG